MSVKRNEPERICRIFRGKEGKPVGRVCVGPSKDMEERDIIIFFKNEGRARSVRSTTELINKLAKAKVPEKEIFDTYEFVTKKLRSLELREAEVKVGSVGVKEAKKAEGRISEN